MIQFASVDELATALRRAADAHHAYEEELGKPDSNWPAWYAHYMALRANQEESK